VPKQQGIQGRLNYTRIWVLHLWHTRLDHMVDNLTCCVFIRWNILSARVDVAYVCGDAVCVRAYLRGVSSKIIYIFWNSKIIFRYSRDVNFRRAWRSLAILTLLLYYYIWDIELRWVRVWLQLCNAGDQMEGICMHGWHLLKYYLRGTNDDDAGATMRCTYNCNCPSYRVSTRGGPTKPYPLLVLLPVTSSLAALTCQRVVTAAGQSRHLRPRRYLRLARAHWEWQRKHSEWVSWPHSLLAELSYTTEEEGKMDPCKVDSISSVNTRCSYSTVLDIVPYSCLKQR
jgi:hypothetical protein